MTTSTLITLAEQLKNVVATITITPSAGGFENQQSAFYRVEPGKVTNLGKTGFKFMKVRGMLVLPHERIQDGKDLGPKRPQLNIYHAPGSEEFNFTVSLELICRTGYEFAKSGLASVFKDVLTFTYRLIKKAPSVTQKTAEPVYEVVAVTIDGGSLPLIELVSRADLTPEQDAAIGTMISAKRIIEAKCLADDGVTKFDTLIFANMGVRIDKKTGGIYQEMRLKHTKFPGNVKHYRGPKNAYNPAMSDVANWGIVIPMMADRGDGSYGQIPGSDWTKDPSCHPVTKQGERNYFMGRVSYEFSEVTEGAGNIRVWCRCDAWKLPIETGVTSEAMFGEEMLPSSPTGPVVSLSGGPACASASASPNASPGGSPAGAASASPKLAGKLHLVDDEDESP